MGVEKVEFPKHKKSSISKINFGSEVANSRAAGFYINFTLEVPLTIVGFLIHIRALSEKNLDLMLT